MARTRSKPAVKTPGIEAGQISNFSGGPNFRDAPTEFAADEAYNAYNVTFDERGGVVSRLGYSKRNSTPLSSSDFVINDYYSPLLSATLTQAGANLYHADNTTAVHTFTTSACVTFAELGGKVLVGHPVDGIFYSTDGTTWTHLATANAPATATCLCTWMSKLFVGMADGSIHWSSASDPLTWSATDFNEVWTKDQKGIVALAVGSGQDIQGRPGLLVFKQESVYRVNDAGTGAYTVLDTSHGAAGPKAVVGVGARVCWIGKGGIWWWREDQASPVNASDLLRPVWLSSELSFANQTGWAAGRYLNRALFSVSTLNSSVNDLALEFHPDEGWVAPRSDAMTCYSVNTSEITYGGSPTAHGQVYQLANGGTDDGAAITGFFQTRWVEPNGGFQAELWMIRLHGRGPGTLTIRTDYADSGGMNRSVPGAAASSSWGSFTWGVGTWMGDQLQQTDAFYGFGACRAFSCRLSFTTSTTQTSRSLFGNVPAPVVGGVSLYGLEYFTIPLGYS